MTQEFKTYNSANTFENQSENNQNSQGINKILNYTRENNYDENYVEELYNIPGVQRDIINQILADPENARTIQNLPNILGVNGKDYYNSIKNLILVNLKEQGYNIEMPQQLQDSINTIEKMEKNEKITNFFKSIFNTKNAAILFSSAAFMLTFFSIMVLLGGKADPNIASANADLEFIKATGLENFQTAKDFAFTGLIIPLVSILGMAGTFFIKPGKIEGYNPHHNETPISQL